MAQTAASESTERSELVGRGARDGARLFREWFQSLSGANERGERTAYVFVMGSMSELLRSFDLHVVFPEVNSIQTAVRKVAQDYLIAAEDYGYSPDICAYMRADVGVQLKGGDHPMARIPRPSLAVINTACCGTHIKWGEFWERRYHIPVFPLDIPSTRVAGRLSVPGDEDFEQDRRYVEHQIRELIGVCERVSGKRFDIDRLREVMGHANEMAEHYRRALETNRARPAPFNALGEGSIFVGVANVLRGLPEGARYFRELVEELDYKAANGIGALADERHRLIFIGVPCFPIFRRFNDLFTDHHGIFTGSTYLHFAGGGWNLGYQYNLARPVESLAEGVLLSVQHGMDSQLYSEGHILKMTETLGADAVVYHATKSCRTVSAGMNESRKVVMERLGLPALYIESDQVDPRGVAEAQIRNRIDAFFEGLEIRKLRAA
jgi:benzoyl-CoA reductase subunit B